MVACCNTSNGRLKFLAQNHLAIRRIVFFRTPVYQQLQFHPFIYFTFLISLSLPSLPSRPSLPSLPSLPILPILPSRPSLPILLLSCVPDGSHDRDGGSPAWQRIVSPRRPWHRMRVWWLLSCAWMDCKRVLPPFPQAVES